MSSKSLGAFGRASGPRTLGAPQPTLLAYTDLANAFTAAQGITLATSGTILSLVDTANDANAEVVDLYRHRGGAAGQDGDDLAELQFNGLDDNGTPQKTKFARILAEIVDASDTTEDGRLSLGTARAGTNVDWVLESGTLRYQGLALPATAGFINAAAYQVAGVNISSGIVIRHGRTTFSTYANTNAVIPNDDSIPQIGEGTQYATIDVTPRNASSILRIKIGLAWTSNGATIGPVAAVFVDATSNAIAATPFLSEVSTTVVNSSMYEWEISAGSTSLRTYSLRVGPGTAGTIYINGDSSARQLGGLTQTFISVEEILP